MERFETFTVLLNRISRNIRRIKNQEMTVCAASTSPACTTCIGERT